MSDLCSYEQAPTELGLGTQMERLHETVMNNDDDEGKYQQLITFSSFSIIYEFEVCLILFTF
jgi:hypothetical protein